MKTSIVAALLAGLVSLSTLSAPLHVHGVDYDDEESSIMQKDLRRSNITNLHTGKKEIIITIDDGPTKGVTDKILDVLKKHNIQAAFFILGEKVSYNKSLLARMVREGHIVANHSMRHDNISEMKIFGMPRKRQIKDAILGAHAQIAPYMTNSSKFYFRAPYGAWQSQAAGIINETQYGRNYYGPVLWDVGGTLPDSPRNAARAADWGCWSKRWTVDQCLTGYINETDKKEGGVVLFHDLRVQSAELIEKYILEYKSRPGYRFISLDDVQID